MLSAIIPTKNRAEDLVNSVLSVMKQSRIPDELIIIDQSSNEESRSGIENINKEECKINIKYIHDPAITGLVDAKRVGVQLAKGTLICFLEDDVILDKDYLLEIERGFSIKPEMMGSCGIITNQPNKSLIYNLVFSLFHRGIYKDDRMKIYQYGNSAPGTLVESNMLSGGLSAWRKEVFSSVKFDVNNGFHMYEDIEFSTRVAQHYGGKLYINTMAKLVHLWSPVNREVLGIKQKRKVEECIMFYKKRNHIKGSTLALVWVLIGMLFESIYRSIASRALSPFQGYVVGLWSGINKQLNKS